MQTEQYVTGSCDMWTSLRLASFSINGIVNVVQLALSISFGSSQGVRLHEGAARQRLPSSQASGK